MSNPVKVLCPKTKEENEEATQLYEAGLAASGGDAPTKEQLELQPDEEE